MNFGNTITLKAEITASPTPSSIQWIRINKKGKNEEIKNKSGKFLIKNLNENCQTLRIENLDFSDNGKYKITVTNAVGEAQNALDIKVGGKHYFLFLFITCIEMLRNSFILINIAVMRNWMSYLSFCLNDIFYRQLSNYSFTLKKTLINYIAESCQIVFYNYLSSLGIWWNFIVLYLPISINSIQGNELACLITCLSNQI